MFFFTVFHVSGFLLTVLTTTIIILYTDIDARGDSGVNANFNHPVTFVWVNANCSYPSAVLSFAICCETIIEGF